MGSEAEPTPETNDLRPPGWRGGVRAASALAAAAGLWIALSPLVVAYTGELSEWSAVVAGGAVALLGFLRSAGLYRSSWISYVNGVLGLWIFASSFWLQGSGGARAITGVFGFAICLLALMSAAYSDHSDHHPASGG